MIHAANSMRDVAGLRGAFVGLVSIPHDALVSMMTSPMVQERRALRYARNSSMMENARVQENSCVQENHWPDFACFGGRSFSLFLL
jgi:hypothetical protein